MPAPDSSTARSLRRRVTRLGTPRIGSAGGAAGARLGQPVERAKLAPVIEYAPMVDAVIAPHVVEADLVHVLDVARIIALRRAELHGQALIARVAAFLLAPQQANEPSVHREDAQHLVLRLDGE